MEFYDDIFEAPSMPDLHVFGNLKQFLTKRLFQKQPKIPPFMVAYYGF